MVRIDIRWLKAFYDSALQSFQNFILLMVDRTTSLTNANTNEWYVIVMLLIIIKPAMFIQTYYKMFVFEFVLPVIRYFAYFDALKACLLFCAVCRSLKTTNISDALIVIISYWKLLLTTNRQRGINTDKKEKR